MQLLHLHLTSFGKEVALPLTMCTGSLVLLLARLETAQLILRKRDHCTFLELFVAMEGRRGECEILSDSRMVSPAAALCFYDNFVASRHRRRVALLKVYHAVPRQME